MNLIKHFSRLAPLEGPLWRRWCRAGGRSTGTMAEELAWQPGVENPLQLVMFSTSMFVILSKKQGMYGYVIYDM